MSEQTRKQTLQQILQPSCGSVALAADPWPGWWPHPWSRPLHRVVSSVYLIGFVIYFLDLAISLPILKLTE